MTGEPVIRPLTAADVPGADAVGWAALQAQIPAQFLPADPELRQARGRARVAHLLATDPDGCWVAEADGEIVAVALALVREDVWGLSLFGVAPGLQGRGIGGRTLAGALRYAEGRRGALIVSSTDPRAMRRYHRAGLALRPSVAAGGQLNRSRLPAGLRSRPGDLDADRPVLEAASRHARGAAHGPDYAAIAAAGGELLVCGDRGFAFHREGAPVLLAAHDDETATDLLWSCLAGGPPGGPVHVHVITAGNDWAVAVALDAGLALEPDGPVFARGETGTLAPYLPSGAYL
ncbi:GNAT family N-acetyltransferase [Baekduia soli]|uniref:GNAT family N-acetyltransferase n=1 Tax=Baekduia soli TaxID=496014 RepID=A0A5B8U6E2_9ACTN|nr:GNAT family N-acetyltransferase [Baekduia soli]QEC48666.1 GNAT family N-acetyltransferase [Baekduia soli]